MQSPDQFPEAYAKAVRNADVEAYANLYDDNVHIFDMWDDWSANGREACRKMAQEWFGSLGTEHVVVTFSNVDIKQTNDVALLTCFVRFAGHSAEGKQLRFMDERMTVGLHKQNSGEWLVVHQHTSTPISSSDMKPKMVKD